MKTIQEILNHLSLVCEIIAAIVAAAYFPKIKSTYWKWFVLYLVFIAFESIAIKYYDDNEITMFLYDFLIVPTEFFFFFWLFAIQSLKRKNLWLTLNNWGLLLTL
jgi:hypothetical protein